MLRAATVALVLLAVPAGAQPAPDEGGGPKSLLPQGFDPAPAAPVARAELPAAAVAGDTPAVPEAAATDTAAPAEAPLLRQAAPTTELPALQVDPFATEATGLPIDIAGPLGETVTGPGAGYGLGTFTGSNGRFIAGVMRRTEPPLASRWAHITLRRALMTESVAPGTINRGDWVAERAWLLLRMGEVDGAKALVDAVPIDRFSRKLYLVAGQAALAAADLPALCPLAATARALSTDSLWSLATGMCAGMTGDDITAATTFDRLRDDDKVDPFDELLAERVATLSGTGGRAANIQWDEVDTLTLYRFGVASAAGVKIPDAMLAKLPPDAAGWIVRSPSLSFEQRRPALRQAAVLGISSSQEMVDFASASSAGLDSATFEATPAANLAAGYDAKSPSDRIAGMRALWEAGNSAGGNDRYAALIETALAAAAFAPDAKFADDAPLLVASMLSAGIVPNALRWWPVAETAGGATRDAVWGLLAAADPGRSVPVTPDRFAAWAKPAMGGDKDSATHRAALLLAGLDGLGKLDSGWTSARSDVGLAKVDNSWTRAIDAAASAGRTGEVIVLAANALQGSWADVPPAHFQHLIAALVRVGRAAEARMIVAEAVMRA